jgi:hypothetical protein
MKVLKYGGFLTLLIISNNAHAGKVYGAIQVNGKAVAQNSSITIKCGKNKFHGTIQKYGRYSINASEGPCTFSLTIQGMPTVSVQIVSYQDPTRYNFKYTSEKLVRI